MPMWWTPQQVPATLSACSTRPGHRGCPSRLPSLAAVCSSLIHIGLQLTAAPPVRVSAEASNANFCGDDYEDSRQCSEPCLTGSLTCPGARTCFAVETCASEDPDLDDAFCGTDYTDAKACTRTCRSGRNAACPDSTTCYKIQLCKPQGPTPMAAVRPLAASPDTGTSTNPSDAEPLAMLPAAVPPDAGAGAGLTPEAAAEPPAAARPAAGPAGSAMTASAGLMTRGATEPAADVEDPTGGRDTGKLVGIAVAIAVALVIVCVSVVLYLRRTRHAGQGRRLELPQVADPGPTHSSRPKPHAASTDDPWTATKSVYATADSAGLPGPGHSSFLPQPPRTLGPATPCSNSAGAQSTSTRSTAASMTNPTRSTADAPRQAAPGPDAARREQIDFIHHQLDLFTEDTPFLEDYLLLGDGPLNRFQGGQAVVQIARERLSSREVAVKCFVSRSAFDAEAALYLGETPLRQFMPRLRMLRDNADGALVDPHGAALPPCIVMEKGESLDIFCERSRPDQAQAYSVALHIARRVADLHAAGFAHRDLKPSNTMWLTRENRWTLIDFGCAARIDSEAPLSYSLGYAAPEIVQADRTGARSMQVTAALDSWALGVLVMELFAGRSVFSMAPGRTTVMAQIAGDVGQQLPWEDRTQRAELLRRLGTLKRPVLALLDRDPAQRLSVQDFVTSCDLVLASTTQRSGD
eukprot:jgi/Ulvmu1/7458/UM037_0001.1